MLIMMMMMIMSICLHAKVGGFTWPCSISHSLTFSFILCSFFDMCTITILSLDVTMCFNSDQEIHRRPDTKGFISINGTLVVGHFICWIYSLRERLRETESRSGRTGVHMFHIDKTCTYSRSHCLCFLSLPLFVLLLSLPHIIETYIFAMPADIRGELSRWEYTRPRWLSCP